VDLTLSYSKIVERYAHFFERPEVRLRFLNRTLAQQSASRERADALLSRVPFLKRAGLYDQALKLWLYHLIFQELGRLLPSATEERRRILRLKGRAPIASRLLFGCYRHRRALAVPCLLLLAASLFGAYHGLAWSARRANDYLAARYRSGKPPAGQSWGRSAVYAQTPRVGLPDYRPEKVWLVEGGEGFERYSNGARVITELETTNRPRGYYLFREGKAATDEGLKREPVGIVYHTSESDMLPFTPDNNSSIESRSRALLEYVRRNKSYNYVIDRFGQIYKIVRDEDAANHAGNSVWSDSTATYVGLNESFLGVCFETKTGESEEQLTEAQLVAGRLLTQVLRSRHKIDDADCVTHALVSVNPSNMRICFHHDWAHGFPFAAFGLSDKYGVAPASVAEFGFTYDDDVVAELGGSLWPGVGAGEEEFRRHAEGAGQKPEEARRVMRGVYHERMELQRRTRAADDGAKGVRAAAETALD
jgi:hypothetical protein